MALDLDQKPRGAERDRDAAPKVAPDAAEATPRPPVPNPPMPEDGHDGPVTLPQTRPGVTGPDGAPAISIGGAEGVLSAGDGSEGGLGGVGTSAAAAVPPALEDSDSDDFLPDATEERALSRDPSRAGARFDEV